MLELLAQTTTQPIVIHSWSPSDWSGLITVVIALLSGTLATAIVNVILKTISARSQSRIAEVAAANTARLAQIAAEKDARLAIIEAQLKAAQQTAVIAKTQSDNNTSQIKENREVALSQLQALQSKVIDAAHATTPGQPIVPPPASHK